MARAEEALERSFSKAAPCSGKLGRNLILPSSQMTQSPREACCSAEGTSRTAAITIPISIASRVRRAVGTGAAQRRPWLFSFSRALPDFFPAPFLSLPALSRTALAQIDSIYATKDPRSLTRLFTSHFQHLSPNRPIAPARGR